jgi:hypothetical protein
LKDSPLTVPKTTHPGGNDCQQNAGEQENWPAFDIPPKLKIVPRLSSFGPSDKRYDKSQRANSQQCEKVLDHFPVSYFGFLPGG